MRDENEIITVNIGKNGVSAPLLAELDAILKKYGRVRIKLLSAARDSADRKQLVDEIRKKTKARVEKAIGNTAILTRKKG